MARTDVDQSATAFSDQWNKCLGNCQEAGYIHLNQVLHIAQRKNFQWTIQGYSRIIYKAEGWGQCVFDEKNRFNKNLTLA